MKLLSSLALFLSLSFPAFSQTYDDALTAARAGDYATAVEIWAPIANDGNVEAQYNLGFVYRFLWTDNLDFDKALKWYEMAASGSREAQNDLGLMYQGGQGVAQDFEKSFQYFTLSAQNGSMRGQYNLGVAYELGEGTAQDYVLAHQWFIESALQDYPLAITSVARDFFIGRAVDKDVERAVKFLEIASNMGDSQAQVWLGEIYFTGNDGVQKNIALALEYYQKAIDQGHIGAALTIAEMYEFGYSVDIDLQRAFSLYLRAADLGSAEGQFIVGQYYLFGDAPVVENFTKAQEYFLASARQDHGKAFTFLGIIQQNGLGVEQNAEAAAQYYEQGMDLGEASSFFEMGQLQMARFPGALGERMAFYYIERAAEFGHGPALMSMALYYVDGLGTTEVDMVKSYMWILLANDAGNPQAQDLYSRAADFFTQEDMNAALPLAQACLANNYQNC